MSRTPDGGGILEPNAGWAMPPAPIGSAPTPPAPRIVGNESYSQCGEDLVVAFTMGYLGIGRTSPTSTWGPNDPVQLNNTYYFYRKGHHGVLVEPNGALCRRLRDRRRGTRSWRRASAPAPPARPTTTS